ncbi:MAG: ATP-binding cassette domain-containing protein [Propionibacteriaceae bacterium]|nr:ATP-binding cassette domain-containing protein [Propionibacteriaceae bacterium]
MPVELADVGHRFGTQPWLFRHLSTQLTPGEMVALTGPSGSGKSTLLGIIAGWTTPAEGRVERPGVTKTNWVFQNPHGVARRSAADHVALPFLARGYRPIQADEQARALLTDFRINHVADRPFAALSGGEAQRLMLARALASAPDLLLVDEPTAQLDLTTAREVSETLSALARQDVIVAIATHDHHIRDACSRIIDLSDHADTP